MAEVGSAEWYEERARRQAEREDAYRAAPRPGGRLPADRGARVRTRFRKAEVDERWHRTAEARPAGRPRRRG